MDFVVELVIQLLIQIVGELFGELLLQRALPRTARLLGHPTTRYVVGAAIAFAFGVAWGQHLSDVRHEPRLLWVSIGLAVVTAALAWHRRYAAPPRAQEQWRPRWRDLLAPPWRWPRQRLLGFTFINIALAIGILVGHQPTG